MTDRRLDVGATHVALPVSNLERSVDFYTRFAGMQVVHRRTDADKIGVAWMSDLTRPFVVVLIETREVDHRLGGDWCHLGIGVASREEVDRLVALAKTEDRRTVGPMDYGYPVGYWAFLVDPDGHNLEVSFGQEVGFTVAQAAEKPPA